MLTALYVTASVLMALPAPALGHSSLVQAGPAAVPIGGAAAVIDGARWPGRGVARIPYFNASGAKWHVAQAVKAWNSSGARVRFVPVPRRRAKVIIVDSRGPRSDFLVSGFASVGYVYPGGSRVQLSRLAHPRRPHYSMAGVATHELGHVLGLGHSDNRCATMNTSVWGSCRGMRACRLLQSDDIRGAIQLYGGRLRMVQPAFCPKPPSKIRATGEKDRYGVTLEWRNPRGPFFDRVAVARAEGKCPRRPGRGSLPVSATDTPGATAELVDRGFATDDRLLTGRYCYAFWAMGEQSLVSRRRTLWVEHDPVRPPAPTDLRAVVGPAGEVSPAWAVGAHPEFEAVEGSAALGRCPTEPNDGDYAFAGDAAGARSPVVLDAVGRYCFVAWTRDSIGALFGPATVWIDHKGSAPEADFGHSWGSSTIEFYDQSYDADGHEIVARRWELGDGTVVDGNDPSPTHTYKDAGTYTVSLTVTDASGLSSATTREVEVSNTGDPYSEDYY